MGKVLQMCLLPLALSVALLSCKAEEATPVPEAPSAYNPSEIRQLAATDLDEAMRLAEEGLRKGQLSAYESYELQGGLIYQFTEDYPLAASFIRKALEQDEAQDPSIRTGLLYRLATILLQDRSYTACLATCTEGKELSHATARYFEEYSFDYLAGNCLFAIGEDDDGIDLMKHAIEKALKVAANEQEFGHLVYFTGNLTNSLITLKEYAAALEECAVNENLLARMEHEFPDAPCGYYDRSRFYVYVNTAVCLAGLGREEEAAKSFGKALNCKYASKDNGRLYLVTYYAAVGDTDSIIKIYDDIPYSKPDTVTRAYRYRISLLGQAYANAGDKVNAAHMDERYESLSGLIKQKEALEGVMTQAAQYDSQHYRLSLDDALNLLDKYQMRVTLLLLALVAAFVAFIFLNQAMARRNDERHRKETESMEKNLHSLQKQVSLITDRERHNAVQGEAEAPEKNLSLAELIEGRKLYLDKNLNRESAASQLGVSQGEISRELSEIEPGLSFPDYIKGLRIRHALHLLGENPDISVSELADKCGFYTTRTLQRAFLAITGKSPSAYAKELKQKK